jgi:hypothetical protein
MRGNSRERRTRESWLGIMRAGGVHSRDEEAEEDKEDVLVRRGAIGWDPWHSLRAEIVWFGSRHLEPESDELAINPVRVLGGGGSVYVRGRPGCEQPRLLCMVVHGVAWRMFQHGGGELVERS